MSWLVVLREVSDLDRTESHEVLMPIEEFAALFTYGKTMDFDRIDGNARERNTIWVVPKESEGPK